MFLELKGVPQFVDCGKLVSTLPFLHADRTNAEYLLLMGIKGELHIRVGEIPCTITPVSYTHLSPERLPDFSVIFYSSLSETNRLYELLCHEVTSAMLSLYSVRQPSIFFLILRST